MGRLILSINTTPDGFCNHAAVIADDELHNYANDLLRNADTVLFGRVTYQLFKDYWPSVAKNRTGLNSVIEFADLVDNIEKIVFSKTLKNGDPVAAEWKKTTVLEEVSKENILKLKQERRKNIILLGSPSVAAKLIELELVDEYNFLIQPIIPGNGKRFFETNNLHKQINLQLTETKTFESGVTVLYYLSKPRQVVATK